VAAVIAIVGAIIFVRRRKRAREALIIEPIMNEPRNHVFIRGRSNSSPQADLSHLTPFTDQHQNSNNDAILTGQDSYSGNSGYGGGIQHTAALPVIPITAPLSSKALVELRHRNENTGRGSLRGLTATNNPAPNSHGPSSSSGRTASTNRSSEDHVATQLRTEVDMLRQEMAQLRAVGYELPPNYEAQ
jgi:hypothetical protein